MRKSGVLLLVLLLVTFHGHAQIAEVVRTFLNDSSRQVTNVVAADSALKELEKQVCEAKANELNLRLELEQVRKMSFAADSVKLARQKQRIDSLRAKTPGFPVVIEEDTLFVIYAKRGGLSPQDRAESFSKNIERLGQTYGL